MICTEKERESCNVEKLGCNGCFYRELTNEEIEQCIKDLTKVRPEKLDDEGLKLFKTIMQILDERDNLRADNYEANNIINDYIEEKQKLIDKLEEDIKDKSKLIELEYEQYKEYYARTGGYPNQMKFNVFKLTGEKNKSQEILSILKR